MPRKKTTNPHAKELREQLARDSERQVKEAIPTVRVIQAGLAGEDTNALAKTEYLRCLDEVYRTTRAVAKEKEAVEGCEEQLELAASSPGISGDGNDDAVLQAARKFDKAMRRYKSRKANLKAANKELKLAANAFEAIAGPLAEM